MLKDLRKNPIMLTDCYNISHQRLKINADWEVSHMYNRAKPMILYGFSEVVNSVLSIKITEEMVNEAERHANRLGLIFPRDLWMGVVNECNGYLPIEVQSLPEGTWCPPGTPFAQIRNTKEGYGEMVTWLEAVFMKAYFPSTCATQAFRMRKYLEQKKKQYGYDDSFMWRFHSFGYRGHRSEEDAYWAATAWSMFLHGTDDFTVAQHIPETAQIGSISALAHKVTQQFDDEYEGFKHAIKATADVGEKIVALVIDTYDANRVIREYLKPLALYAEKLGVHIVMRPDSGDTWQQAVDIYRECNRGMKLNNVSVIIGEAMDFETAKKADAYFEAHGVPLNFVAYGIGGGFYGYMNRDTLGWAMKTAYSNGKPRMKFSMNPIKRSIPGIVVVNRNEDGDLVVSPEKYPGQPSLYQTIYKHNWDLEPHIVYADWNETRERAFSQKTDQHIIYLDKEIQELIQQFHNTYRTFAE